MVPAGSRRISRAPRYSGAGLPRSAVFGYGAFTRCGRPFQSVPLTLKPRFVVRSYNPGSAVTDPVWPLPRSLATTSGISVDVSSSPYLDVSVHRVPLHALWIQTWIHGVFPCGFPHSDIRGSRDICSSPRLFAAYHVFHRLSVPRHPPCALSCLTTQ